MTIVVGIPGVQGPPGLSWQGAWSSIVTYTQGQGVSYNGAGYVALSSSINVVPGTAPLQWSLLVQAPPMGASGPNHAPGMVPDPGSTAGVTRYLREDGTWDAPPTGGSFSAFYVAPNGFSGSTPAGYTLVTQNSSNIATVTLAAGYNLVDIAVGGIGTVNLVANAQPFAVDLVDGDGGLSTVTVNRE